MARLFIDQNDIQANHTDDIEPEEYLVESMIEGKSGIRDILPIFKSADYSKTGIPLPSPKYISIHYAIAKILHTSRAGIALEKAQKRAADISGANGPVTADIHNLYLTLSMPNF